MDQIHQIYHLPNDRMHPYLLKLPAHDHETFDRLLELDKADPDGTEEDVDSPELLSQQGGNIKDICRVTSPHIPTHPHTLTRPSREEILRIFMSKWGDIICVWEGPRSYIPGPGQCSYLDQDSVHAVEVGDGVAGRSRLEVIVGGKLIQDLRGDV